MGKTEIGTEQVRDDSIIDADISSSAAIAGTKISADFGEQAVRSSLSGGEYIEFDMSSTVLGTLQLNSASTDFEILHGATRTFFADGGTGYVGFGTNSPSQQVHLQNNSAGGVILLERNDSSTSGTMGELRFGNRNSDDTLAYIKAAHDGSNTNSYLEFGTEATGGANTRALTLNSTQDATFEGAVSLRNNENLYFRNQADSGIVGHVKVTTADVLEIGTNSNADMQFNANGTIVAIYDESLDHWGFGTSSPIRAFHVEDDSADYCARFENINAGGYGPQFINAGTGTGFYVGQNGAGTAVIIDQNANGRALQIDSSQNNYSIISENAGATASHVHYLSVTSANSGSTLKVLNTHASTTGAVFQVEQSGTGPAATFSGGDVGIGETSTDATLTVNQGAEDGKIFTLKSSDIAHDLTGKAEADTFFALQKWNATQGGVQLTALNEGGGLDDTALGIVAYTGNSLNDAHPVMKFIAAKSDGASAVTELAAAETAYKFQNNNTALMTIFGNADVTLEGALQIKNASGTTPVDGYVWTATDANGNGDWELHTVAAHTIASHSDTTATGTELETLTDGSNADALHDHTGSSISGLAVADFTSPNISNWTNDSNYAGSGSTETISGSWTFTQSPKWNDNIQIQLGTGSDSRVYYSGAGFFIDNLAAAGNINLRVAGTENAVVCTENGAVTLYHNGSSKLATSATGASVTGTLAATTVTGANVTSGANPGHTHTSSSISGLAVADFTSPNISNWTNDSGYITSAPAHTIASHSDTTATGTELETLTNGSNADALHVHAGASHTIASHSDTTATGTELETLTDGSNADALHVHAAASHTIASHSDTTATGTELETLTDGSNADSLHTHTTIESNAIETAMLWSC